QIRGRSQRAHRMDQGQSRGSPAHGARGAGGRDADCGGTRAGRAGMEAHRPHRHGLTHIARNVHGQRTGGGLPAGPARPCATDREPLMLMPNPAELAPGAKLTIDRVSKWFRTPAAAVHALDRVSLDVADGEILCLVGPSGCGKTTLLDIIAGLTKPDE